MKKVIVVAGGTGNLGERVIKALLASGAEVRALIRASSNKNKIEKLQKSGVQVIPVNLSYTEEVARACAGATCVVSTLSGLRDVIVDAQKVLLHAAIAAGVPRFIPSDYSIDFTRLEVGENRNLDLRKEFQQYLDQQAGIAATTIFIGAFADMLTGQMPLILFKLKRVLYWGSADQRMDFTTMDDTAAYTAYAALDEATPRYLRIAGDVVSARQLKVIVSNVAKERFHLFRVGGLGMLRLLIKIARKVAPGEQELYPAWQGMQYMHNMLSGKAKLNPLDNNRYPAMRWTTVREVLTAHQVSSGGK